MAMQIKNFGGKIGSYAISTIDTSSWMNEPIVSGPPRTRKSRGVKEVLHRIFSDCAGVIEDPFWIEKLNQAAFGKFPAKFSFNDGTLLFRKGTRCYSLEVSNNPYESAHQILEFIRTHGGIFSPTDKQYSIELDLARQMAARTREKLTWGDASKKMQECLLSYFIMSMKTVMTLSDYEVEYLRQTIRLAISNKFFGKHNIKVEENRIQSIEGLLWNGENRTFYLHPDLKPVAPRSSSQVKDGPPVIDPSQKDMVPQFGIKWQKYIEELDKKIVRNLHRQQRISAVASEEGTTGDWSTPRTDRRIGWETNLSATDITTTDNMDEEEEEE